ncbi:MAG: UDP-N-acetylmuramoyl-tripeptide--D-alanyl-D-alanine ligase [Candidatus Buchananbacteria bacterium]
MKSFFKNILKKILFALSAAILNKYEPKVIAVTGSIGKSSTKEAIFTVLKDKFRVRQNIKNYNNEIGLPLTILGELSPDGRLLGWLKIFYRAGKLWIMDDKGYPEVLILEMGVDRPGDMTYLVKLAKPDIGVITNIGPVHLQYFKTIENIAREKGILVDRLRAGGWGVLNADNEYTAKLKNSVKGRFLTYGFSSEASVRAHDVVLLSQKNDLQGVSFKLSYDGKVAPVFLPEVLGEHLIYGALAAISVGIIMGLNLVEIIEALQNFRAPSGRMRLIEGVRDSLIIDDTYNASPEPTIAAVQVLGKLPANGRKIAVLGDMLELGDFEDNGHRLVGQTVAQEGINLLIAVGARAKIIAEAAVAAGFDNKHVIKFADSEEAGEYLLKELNAGDLVLIKGSQGMRMEKTVKIILADLSLAKELLVRQDDSWLK